MVVEHFNVSSSVAGFARRLVEFIQGEYPECVIRSGFSNAVVNLQSIIQPYDTWFVADDLAGGSGRGKPRGGGSGRGGRVTKSQRPRVPEKSRTHAKRAIPHGLELVNVTGDGNCQMRAVAFGLDNSDINGSRGHASIRRDVCQELRKNPDAYKSFLDAKFASVDDFANYFSKDRTWGSEITLRAAAACQKISIELYGESGKIGTYGLGSPVSLFFHSRHYMSLIPSGFSKTSGTRTPPRSTTSQNLIAASLERSKQEELGEDDAALDKEKEREEEQPGLPVGESGTTVSTQSASLGLSQKDVPAMVPMTVAVDSPELKKEKTRPSVCDTFSVNRKHVKFATADGMSKASFVLTYLLFSIFLWTMSPTIQHRSVGLPIPWFSYDPPTEKVCMVKTTYLQTGLDSPMPVSQGVKNVRLVDSVQEEFCEAPLYNVTDHFRAFSFHNDHVDATVSVLWYLLRGLVFNFVSPAAIFIAGVRFFLMNRVLTESRCESWVVVGLSKGDYDKRVAKLSDDLRPKEHRAEAAFYMDPVPASCSVFRQGPLDWVATLCCFSKVYHVDMITFPFSFEALCQMRTNTVLNYSIPISDNLKRVRQVAGSIHYINHDRSVMEEQHPIMAAALVCQVIVERDMIFEKELHFRLAPGLEGAMLL